MQHSKLIDLLKSLDEFEWRDLYKFLKKNHPDKNSKHHAFLKILLKEYPEFDLEALERKQLHVKLFGEANTDDIKLRRLMSELYAEAEEFILSQRLQQKPLGRLVELMGFFIDKNLPRHFEQANESFEELVNATRERDYTYYLNKLLWQQEKIVFQQRMKNKELEKEDLVLKLLYGDLHFILLRLEEFLVFHSYHEIYGLDIK